MLTVITGCSTGIGYATALRCGAEGHRVVATMRDPGASDLGDVARQLGLDLTVLSLDVDDDTAVDRLFKEVDASHGAVDLLVNNAGVGGGGSPVEETVLDTYRAVMETNFFGVLRCTQAVLPTMRERGAGCIVTVSSQAGRFAAPAMSAYSASKHAVEAAMETLAIEVAPFGVRVALVEPGAIMTAIWSKIDTTPPTGPYAPLLHRLGATVLEDIALASPAEEVAECILRAATVDAPRLRWAVGRGAARNLATRAALTDEEYLALWHAPDDEFRDRWFAGSDQPTE